MPELILGPLLRYVGERDATIWVETDAAREVEVRLEGSAHRSGHRSRTFRAFGHHYALVRVEGLQPGKTYPYEVLLDGEKVWPEPGYQFPPPAIRTADPEAPFTLAFGSCRISAPHEPPYTLSKGQDGRGYGRDALYALALGMRNDTPARWPRALLLLGDQIYADEVSPGALDFVRSRRDPGEEPGDQAADFEEYTRLYRDAWQDPAIRWLLSAVPSAMIFDDHDVHDDWNTSEAWVREMREKPWWEERIIGAFASYWIYQHLGNLSPNDLGEDELWARVRGSEDATRILREFAHKADREVAGIRWSFHRDFDKTRLIVADSRAGRVVKEGHRSMLDGEEWAWIEEKATGEFDHLLIGTSLPFLLSPGLHHLEAWNEALCAGPWGRPAAWLSEKVRQTVDLEHWSAFHDSFRALADLLRSVAAGERSGGRPPASVVVLSGDVHHGYLAEASFEEDGAARSPVYQAVGSPLRNPLGRVERFGLRAGWSRAGTLAGKTLSRLAGVPEPRVRWRLTHREPWFENHISTLELNGREARLKVEKTDPGEAGDPRLRKSLERRLA